MNTFFVEYPASTKFLNIPRQQPGLPAEGFCSITRPFLQVSSSRKLQDCSFRQNLAARILQPSAELLVSLISGSLPIVMKFPGGQTQDIVISKSSSTWITLPALLIFLNATFDVFAGLSASVFTIDLPVCDASANHVRNPRRSKRLLHELARWLRGEQPTLRIFCDAPYSITVTSLQSSSSCSRNATHRRTQAPFPIRIELRRHSSS